MNAQQQKQQKGFTIIEVILVLAIAGLIFLMVFLALPALQRGQRDTDRKNDASSIASAVTTYTSNNRGQIPEEDDVMDYATNLSSNTTEVEVNDNFTNAVSPDDGTAVVTFGSECGEVDANSADLNQGSARQFTVVQRLESGGNDGSYYCLDS